MKQGWEAKRLGEVIKLEYGKPLDKTKREITGLYPVYGANGEKARSNEYYYDKASIIVGRKGSAGEINITTEKFWPLDVTYFVTFDERKYNLKFLFHLLSTLNLPKMAKGVKPGINRNDVYSQDVLIPQLPEQKRIVKILDEAFAAIDKAKANAEKNLQNSRELFDSYLNEVFANPGEDWDEKMLKDVCHKIQDGAHHSPKKLYNKKANNKFLYITSKNIRNNFIDLSKIFYVDKNYHDSIFPRCNPTIGDLLLTKDGANTGNVTLNTINEPFSLLSSVCLIKTNEDLLLSAFLKFYIQSPVGFKNISGQMTGAAIKRIVLKVIKASTLAIPSILIQNRIVVVLEKLSLKTQKLEAIYQQKLVDLEELKKSILQKAFDGQL